MFTCSTGVVRAPATTILGAGDHVGAHAQRGTGITAYDTVYLP